MTTEEAAEDLRYLDSLNGRKIISRGNHDYWWPSMSKLNTFFSENGITTVDALHNNAFIRDGITVCGTRGWYNDGKNAPPETEYKKIVDREAGRLRLSLDAGRRLGADGETVVFLHFPPVFGGFVCRELVAVLHEYSVKRCVYGHIHGMYELEASNEFEGISFIPASADYLNFVPLRISSS